MGERAGEQERESQSGRARGIERGRESRRGREMQSERGRALEGMSGGGRYGEIESAERESGRVG